MALFGYSKKDAAACLTAAVLCALDEEQHVFIGEVARLISARSGQGRTDTIQTMLEKATISSFEVIHWLYGAIEEYGITGPDIFCLLGRFGATFDNGMLQLSAPRGDHPSYLFIG